jgi:hypothetical protein
MSLDLSFIELRFSRARLGRVLLWWTTIGLLVPEVDRVYTS